MGKGRERIEKKRALTEKNVLCRKKSNHAVLAREE